MPQEPIEVNSLVIVLPQGKPLTPPVACWGVLEEETSDNLLKVRLGSERFDVIYAHPEQVIPFLQTDGLFKDPQRVFTEHEEDIILHLLLSFLSKQGVIRANERGPADLPEPSSLIPIQENTLAIVLPQNSTKPTEPCWGLVLKRIVGGKYDVQVGRFRYLGISRIIVEPQQLVPVYLTDGSFKNPKHAVRQLRAQLFLHLVLMFYSSEGSEFLRKISRPLSKSGFVLLSRKGKVAPLPDKKPEN